MTKTDAEVREEMAEQFRTETFKDNPNGFTVADYINGDLIELFFEHGWSACLEHSPVVRELEMAIEAMMKCENDVRPCDMCCASGTHTLAKLQAARKGEG